MKAIFYSELYPIRSNPLEYFKVVKLYLELMKNNSIDAKVICRPEISRLLIKKDRYSRDNFVPLSENILKNISMKNGWDSKYIKSWIDYLNGDDKINIFDYMEDVFSTYFEFDTLFLWGKNDNLRRFSIDKRIKIIHLELTPTRKPFLQGITIDSLGVNGESSTRYMVKNDSHESLREKGYVECIKLQSVLIPLQLFDDVNFQIYSSYENITDFLLAVVPKLCKAGFNVYIKKHPGAVHRKVNDVAQEIAISKIRKREKVTIINDLSSEDYEKFLKDIDAVVTVNSSVGFEAAILGKPVVVLGKAMYKTKDTFFSLDELISRNISKSKINYTISMLNHIKEKVFFLEEFFDFNDFFLEKVNAYFKDEAFDESKNRQKKIRNCVEYEPTIEIEYRCDDYIQVKIDGSRLGLSENIKKAEFFLGLKKISYDFYPEWESKIRRFYIPIDDKEEKICRIKFTTITNKINFKEIQ